ncbi:MAG: 5'/3'-nucleotidase SurE [Proteobacteria bacterium]|nr:5'/3'-nucleotidase SurE [Pseudomonadota bacterium]
MNILVTNDDGIFSEGIKALAQSLMSMGDVYVVAPDRERSAAGHSLTLHHPLRVEEVSKNHFSVDGTPTDCVNLAMNGILPFRPDIIVSGINKGANMGDDITYSGTVSAAMEGTLLGIPSVAFSLDTRKDFDFSVASNFSLKVVKKVLEIGMPKDTLLNVNVPHLSENEIKGCKITRQGKRVYGDAIVEKVDPRGRKYFWIGGDDLGFEHVEDSDFQALAEGYISITPLHLDLTNYSSMDELGTWRF